MLSQIAAETLGLSLRDIREEGERIRVGAVAILTDVSEAAQWRRSR